MKEPTSGGVIWLTGYPGAGKTSVAAEVHTLLEETGSSAVLLDGDHLRALFGRTWGYTREARVELALIYIKLSNYLASQGHTVVIAAVAMFSEVEEWAVTNISRFLEVYLDVPERERLRRAELQGKTVYTDDGAKQAKYDAPKHAGLIIDNSDGVEIRSVARAVFDLYVKIAPQRVESGRKSYWADFYSKKMGVLDSSPFAQSVAALLPDEGRLLEIGCGNGRDAAFMKQIGQQVTATDVSQEAIDFCQEKHKALGISFMAGHLPNIEGALQGGFDTVYTRFVLHSMTEGEETEVLGSAYRLLKEGGEIHIECRSVNDPLARKGEVLSPTERFYGHYRRFVRRHELEEKLQAVGFSVSSCIESNGLAIFGDEDPVVIRITARRTS